MGATKNICRMRYARPENLLRHVRSQRVYTVDSALNADNVRVLTQTTNDYYNTIKLTKGQYSREAERAMPQHLDDGSAHPDWEHARSVDPGNPGGVKPENASSIYKIFKLNRCTKPQQQIRLEYLQGKTDHMPALDAISAQMCKQGHANEINGVATALKYLCEGTKKKGEQVGIIRLVGEFSWIAASLDVVLHVPTPDGSGFDEIPLEIKCPSTMFGRVFNGALKLHHLIQLHVQMRAVMSTYAYILYWTPEESHLYRVDFDQELWDLMAQGMRVWRRAVVGQATHVPNSPEEKNRNIAVADRLSQIYDKCLQSHDYTWLPSFVVLRVACSTDSILLWVAVAIICGCLRHTPHSRASPSESE